MKPEDTYNKETKGLMKWLIIGNLSIGFLTFILFYLFELLHLHSSQLAFSLENLSRLAAPYPFFIIPAIVFAAFTWFSEKLGKFVRKIIKRPDYSEKITKEFILNTFLGYLSFNFIYSASSILATIYKSLLDPISLFTSLALFLLVSSVNSILLSLYAALTLQFGLKVDELVFRQKITFPQQFGLGKAILSFIAIALMAFILSFSGVFHPTTFP